MEASSLLFVAGALAVCVVTAAATRWWYRRRIVALAAQLDKVDRARHYALQQVSQARKQVEKLQRELSETRRPVTPASQLGSERRPAGRVASAAVVSAPTSAVTTAASEPQAASKPANGFADTMPM